MRLDPVDGTTGVLIREIQFNFSVQISSQFLSLKFNTDFLIQFITANDDQLASFVIRKFGKAILHGKSSQSPW